jgi:vacuolar-type H+-ATPase subunit H
MHQPSEQPEFVKTVKEIKNAEEEYDRLINSAKEKAEKTVREAREKALDERTRTEEEIVGLKDERLRKGSEAIEAEVQKLVKKAREEASSTGKKSMNAQAVSKLVKDFLGSL